MTFVEELIEEFSDLDEREACECLDEYGRELPEVPASIYDSQNLVPGCQSRVWLVARMEETDSGNIRIQADSDAIVVKGLIYIVLQLYDGLTPQEVLDVDYVATFDKLGLGRLILPQRKNGLYAMVKRIRDFAMTQQGASASKTTMPGAPREVLSPPPVPVTRSLTNIVDEFPILCRPLPNGQRPVFLDSGASAQKPIAVIEKQREVEEQYYANAFRGRYYFGQRVDDEIEGTRQKVAQLLHATTDEIVFTSGTTISVNMVAAGWGRRYLKPGDEIVVTEMEHHANFVPWQVIAQETGAQLKVLPVTKSGHLMPMETVITDRTALVAVCSMSNVLGTENPIKEIAAMAHAHGALVFVDAAQSVPHAKTDVAEMQVDFLTFSGHKLYGPSGVGVLYGRREHLDGMDPFLYGGHMIQSVTPESSTWAEVPAKLEAGTPPIVQIVGLGAAIDFVQSIGFEAIQAHERKLLEAAHARLGDIPGLTIHGPSVADKGAIVSFSIDGVSTEDLARRLDQRGVFTRHGHHCAMILHRRLGVPSTTRASFGLYNTLDDIEALATAIEFGLEDISRFSPSIKETR